MLKDVLGLNKNDVVSIVGAGGKTTMMFTLASELKKVCITTTTKILVPSADQYDELFIDDFPELKDRKNRVVITGPLFKNKKLTTLSETELDKVVDHFDYTIIEADGSNEKSLKGWKEHEPVINKHTTKTVGIVDISVVGKKCSDETVFRVELFKEMVDIDDEDINTSHLIQMIQHKKGLFKDSRGERVLFINKVEDDVSLDLALELAHKAYMLDTVDRVVIGSLFDQTYYLYSKGLTITGAILAAGLSSRMGTDKLSLDYQGKMIVEHVLEKIKHLPLLSCALVTQEDKFKHLEETYNVSILENKKYKLGISESIKLGVNEFSDGYMYFVGDQPFLSLKTLLGLISEFNLHETIVMCQSKKHTGNPAIFHKNQRAELLALEGEKGAKSITKSKVIHYVQVQEQELIDIDTKEQYETIIKHSKTHA